MRKWTSLPPLSLLHDRFSYSIVEGVIYYKRKWRKNNVNDVAGYYHKSTGRWAIKLNGRAYFRSRLIWFMVTGIDPEDNVIDHIDRDKSNDAFHNLRLTDNSENNLNRQHRHNPLGKFIYYTPSGGYDYYQVSVRRKGIRIQKKFYSISEAQSFIDNHPIISTLDEDR